MISTHFVSIHSKVGCCRRRVPGIINFAPLYPRHWPFNHFVHIWHFVVGSGWQFPIGCNCFPYLIFVLTLPILLWKEICEEFKLQVANDHQLSCHQLYDRRGTILKQIIFWHFTNYLVLDPFLSFDKLAIFHLKKNLFVDVFFL